MSQLSVHQMAEWEAYDQIDPIGSIRYDILFASMASMITNLAIGIHGRKGAKMTNPKDFLPAWLREEPKQQTADDMKEFLLAFAKEHNKRVEEEQTQKERK